MYGACLKSGTRTRIALVIMPEMDSASTGERERWMVLALEKERYMDSTGERERYMDSDKTLLW